MMDGMTKTDYAGIRLHDVFARLVRAEIDRQHKLFPGRGVASMHEAYGVLMEEVDEFWDQVKLKPENRDVANVVEELVQIAAYVSRVAAELDLIYEGDQFHRATTSQQSYTLGVLPPSKRERSPRPVIRRDDE